MATPDINAIYRDMFGRDADADGLAYWQGKAPNYATEAELRAQIYGTAVPDDKTRYYQQQQTKAAAPATPDITKMLDPFAQMMTQMGQNQTAQQQGYQQSIAALMNAWTQMAQPQTPATSTSPTTTPNPTNPYGAKDGIGQTSAVYNPMGQNGLNFGFGANNPFGATF